MELGISVVTAQESHFENLIALGQTFYEKDHPALSVEFLRWFYLENPVGPATLVVAHENGMWIGVIVLIPLDLQNKSEVQGACFAVNVLTHPEHRGKSLFTKMIREAKEYLAKRNIWLLGHPNASAVAGWKRQKMQFRQPLHLHVAKMKLPFGVRTHPIKSEADLEKIPEKVWTDFSRRRGVRVRPTREFFKWRYLNSPHKKYCVAAVENKGEIVGLRVTRKFKGPFDLLIDYVGDMDLAVAGSLSSRRPTLLMHAGSDSRSLRAHSWRVPSKRQFPFFVTTWREPCDLDMTGITLAASDF